jgi:hypothetical protein
MSSAALFAGDAKEISRLIHARPIFKADQDDRLSPRPRDDDRLMVCIDAVHDGRQVGSEFSGGQGAHGAKCTGLRTVGQGGRHRVRIHRAALSCEDCAH